MAVRDEYERAFDAWSAGERTRELALNLAFLTWYSCAEPQELSGLVGVVPSRDLPREIFDYLGGAAADDEVLFVFAVMAEVAAFCLGDEAWWDAAAAQCWNRLAGRVPAPGSFDARTEYGKYFAHQARGHSAT